MTREKGRFGKLEMQCVSQGNLRVLHEIFLSNWIMLWKPLMAAGGVDFEHPWP